MVKNHAIITGGAGYRSKEKNDFYATPKEATELFLANHDLTKFKTENNKMKPHQKRFVEEYRQLTQRLSKLDKMLKKYAQGTLGFEPDCPIRLLQEQRRVMSEYVDILEARAKFEGVDLE